MTDLERYEPTPQDVAITRLAEWANSAQAASQVAAELVKTSFVPEGFRGKPYEATAAILAGLEVGLSPMSALRAFDVIQGQAAPRAITLRAVVQAAGHEVELVESTTTRCKMRGRRRGASGWQEVVWTIDRAKQLGVTGKSNWRNQPQAMLVARATSELCRLVAADAILGIGYSAEEVADGGPVDAVVEAATVDPEPVGKRRMSRQRPKPEPEPDPDPELTRLLDEEEAIARGNTNGDGPSKAQTAMAMALFTEAGITDRDERLTATSAYIGRDVGTWKDVTRDEASKVIDALRNESDGGEPGPPGDELPL